MSERKIGDCGQLGHCTAIGLVSTTTRLLLSLHLFVYFLLPLLCFDTR